MKLTCNLKNIQEAVMKADRLAGKNASLPILESLLLEAEGKQLTVRSTNLQVGVEISIPAKVEEGGSVAVTGSLLSGIFSNVSGGGEVELSLDDGGLQVKTQGSSMVIKTLPTEDYPTLPKVSEGNQFTLPVDGLIEGVKSVVYAAAISEIKPEIASVYVYVEDENLVFVATDSFRLAEKKIPVSGVVDFPGILIPAKNASELVKILADVEGEVALILSDTQLVCSGDGFYCTLRVLDGIFPDYRQIMPKDFTTEIVVLQSDLVGALRLMNVFSDKFNQLSVVVDPADKIFTVATKNFSVGENITHIDAALSGEAVEMNINHRYLVDAFQSIGDDSIRLDFQGERKPLTVRGITDNSFTYLVMPMNR